VIRRGQNRDSIKAARAIGDAFIIGGDDHFINVLAFLTAFPNVLNQRLSRDVMKRLSWEPGGPPARRNNDED